MTPEVRYARPGDVSISYQVVGDGPFVLVWTPGALSHLELRWEDEAVARFYGAISQTVKDLVAGSGIEFQDRGGAELKGVPGEWRLYAVAASEG